MIKMLIINIYAGKNRVLKYKKKKLREWKGKNRQFHRNSWKFYTRLPITAKTTTQKIKEKK